MLPVLSVEQPLGSGTLSLVLRDYRLGVPTHPFSREVTRMAFRFRKTLRLAPGLRLNLSKGGASFSVGGKGLTLNLGKRGARTTVGIPGTGLSYSQQHSIDSAQSAPPSRLASLIWLMVFFAAGAWLFATFVG